MGEITVSFYAKPLPQLIALAAITQNAFGDYFLEQECFVIKNLDELKIKIDTLRSKVESDLGWKVTKMIVTEVAPDLCQEVVNGLS